MLDKVIGGVAGFSQGYGHKDSRNGGYGFQEHKEFVSQVGAGGGYSRYDHRMKLPANHGRPPMAHMSVWDEEDSDADEYFESSRSHHTTALPHHSNNHHQQPPHGNFMQQPHHNGKIGNGWPGQHGDAFHGGHGMQQHGGHGMQHHSEHGMKLQGGFGIQHHGEHGMQHHDMHGMQHQGGHGMQHQAGLHGMKHDKYMAPQVPPHHGYMNPNHGSGDGRTVVVKTTANWQVSSGGRKQGWGSKGL